MANVLKKKDLAFSQVGFGSEHGTVNIGSYWFYCNASNVFVQKCPSLYNRFVTCNSFFGMPTLISFKRVAVVPSIEDRSRRMGTIGLLAHVQNNIH